jgi:hypothetical protein
MAPRRCKYVEYDWYPNGRWLLTAVWNHGVTLMDARIEIIGPNEPAVQVHVETVATAIDALIDAADGSASTRLKMGSAALGAVASLDAESGERSPG